MKQEKRPADQGLEPNRSEMVMYGTAGEFRPTAVRLYAHRSMLSEQRAEEILRAEMVALGMDPEPTGRVQPVYQKAN